MGVSGGGLDLVVAEQLADGGQPFADQQAAAGEAVAEIVDAQVLDPGALQDAMPRLVELVEIGEMGAPL